MMEIFCDFAVMLIVIVRDCRRAQTGHCAAMAKVCLTELIKLHEPLSLLVRGNQDETVGSGMGRDGPL